MNRFGLFQSSFKGSGMVMDPSQECLTSSVSCCCQAHRHSIMLCCFLADAELTLAPGPAVDLSGAPSSPLAPAPEPASAALSPDQIVLIQFRLVLIGTHLHHSVVVT